METYWTCPHSKPNTWIWSLQITYPQLASFMASFNDSSGRSARMVLPISKEVLASSDLALLTLVFDLLTALEVIASLPLTLLAIKQGLPPQLRLSILVLLIIESRINGYLSSATFLAGSGGPGLATLAVVEAVADAADREPRRWACTTGGCITHFVFLGNLCVCQTQLSHGWLR